MAKTKSKTKVKTKTSEPRGIIGCSRRDDGKICVECDQDDKFITFIVEHLDEVIDTLKDCRKALKAGKVS